MRNKFKNYSQEIYDLLEPRMVEEDISRIKNIGGHSAGAPRACMSGSSVYILLSQSDEVLYVGETGKSIKSRCFGDGSGSHCKKPWFAEVVKVRHYTADGEAELSKMERKLSEHALSIHLSPAHYG